VQLYLHSPNVFLAWCLIKYRDNFTLHIYRLIVEEEEEEEEEEAQKA
jgi:hypothetical protein